MEVVAHFSGCFRTGLFSRDGRVSLYLRDPDGVNVEITVPTTEVTQNDLKEMDASFLTFTGSVLT